MYGHVCKEIALNNSKNNEFFFSFFFLLFFLAFCPLGLNKCSRPSFPVYLTPAYKFPGSPSHVGDVTVYVLDINQPGLPTPFHSVLVSVSVCKALSTKFHSINSLDNYSLSHSLLLVLFLSYWSFLTICLIMKVSLSPDIILCGWLGLKHQLTNQRIRFSKVWTNFHPYISNDQVTHVYSTAVAAWSYTRTHFGPDLNVTKLAFSKQVLSTSSASELSATLTRSGQARLVCVKNINRNIPTTWRWARGDLLDKTRTVSDFVWKWPVFILFFSNLKPDFCQ